MIIEDLLLYPYQIIHIMIYICIFVSDIVKKLAIFGVSSEQHDTSFVIFWLFE